MYPSCTFIIVAFKKWLLATGCDRVCSVGCPGWPLVPLGFRAAAPSPGQEGLGRRRQPGLVPRALHPHCGPVWVAVGCWHSGREWCGRREGFLGAFVFSRVLFYAAGGQCGGTKCRSPCLVPSCALKQWRAVVPSLLFPLSQWTPAGHRGACGPFLAECVNAALTVIQGPDAILCTCPSRHYFRLLQHAHVSGQERNIFNTAQLH